MLTPPMLHPPTALPSPGSETLTEALSLISAFGRGDTNLTSMLEQMKTVQKDNEATLKQAITEYDKVVAARELYHKDVEEFYDSRSAHKDYMDAQNQMLNDERVVLEKLKTDFHDRKTCTTTAMNDQQKEMNHQQASQDRGSLELERQFAAFHKKNDELDQREKSARMAECRLYSIKEFLKGHL